MTEIAADVGRDSVGPYRLIRAIGAGGSARIDLARIDRAYNFQRHVVVKRPLEHLRRDKAVAASLQREARLGGLLRHPNLVAVLDAGVHDGYDYLILEYIHGSSLRTLMQRDDGAGGAVRELPIEVALGLVIDLARGLHHAHELADEAQKPLGLVHRDVSPGNVLLGLDGSVKLADFGIAKETRVATLSGSMHGTVTYMAPEQCRGHAFDRRADVFSVGVILYELVTQHRLFWADNDVASLHRVLSGQVERPRKLKPALSPTLEDIVMTAVAHAADQRFATARALADALEQLAANDGHVVGARMLARAMEERFGAIDLRTGAPWIEATTTVDPVRPSGAWRATEVSLVAVIEGLQPERESEPILPTFGPTDPSLATDDVTPAPTTATDKLAPPPRPNKRGLAIAIAAGLIAGAAAIAFVVATGGSGEPDPAARVEPAPTPATPPRPAPAKPPAAQPPAVALPAASEPPVAPPAPAEPAAQPPVAEPPPAEQATAPVRTTPPLAPPPHRRHRNRDAKPAAGSAAPPVDSVATPADGARTAGSVSPSAGTAGSAAPPATGSARAAPTKVEWSPDMLLPTDSGSARPR